MKQVKSIDQDASLLFHNIPKYPHKVYCLLSQRQEKLFLHIFWVDSCTFMGSLIPLFWTYGNVSSGFQSQSGQPSLHLREGIHDDT